MIAFDTNILVYAEVPNSGDPRHRQAANLLSKAGLTGGVLPIQVLGEFLQVCRRKKILDVDLASAKVETFSTVFEIASTEVDDLLAAQQLLKRFNLQFFDALIVTIAIRAGATLMISEDMHDGLDIDGLRIVNPFVAANDTMLADYFGSFG